MKPSLNKIHKILSLEVERGYDNHAVMGGLDRFADHWQPEALNDGVPPELVQLVCDRLRDYPRLSVTSRQETLQGLLRRIQRGSDEAEPIVTAVSPEPATPRGAPPVSQTKPATPAVTTPPARPREQAEPAASPAALDAPVTVLPGVGPRHAQTLARLGLKTLRDMLYYLPRRYDDYTRLKPINRLEYGETVTVIGAIENTALRSLQGGRMKAVEAILTDGSASLRITWFNQTWLEKRLRKGMYISVSGQINQYLGRPVMTNPEWEPIDQGLLHTNRIVPIYPLTANITQRWLRRMMNEVVVYWAPRVPEILPREVRQSANVVDLANALIQVHFPDSWDTLQAAQQRLAFDEIFLLQLGVLRQKRDWENRTAQEFTIGEDWLNQRLQRLPFPLTNAQGKAVAEVRGDLASGRPMNRLLQGDVGSGKTVVASLAMEIVLQAGAQAAIMAPTSILAEQHYRTLTRLLAEPAVARENWNTNSTKDAKDAKEGEERNTNFANETMDAKEVMISTEDGEGGEEGVGNTNDVKGAEISIEAGEEEPTQNHEGSEIAGEAGEAEDANEAETAEQDLTQIHADTETPDETAQELNLIPPIASVEQIALLVGATPEADKRSIRQRLAEGTLRVVVGTHALIEDPVEFANLQLVVVDEQHRFGVEQRAALRRKGQNPHLLVMTATPIPRSLALTVYGDLDLTVMDEMPPGRMPVGTYLVMPRERERAYNLIRSQVHKGRQAFMIYPLVEESERSEAMAAVEEHARLQKEVFPELKLGLLHGRMKAEEKDAVMARFRDGETQVLVSTSVVEVGVDVPNATVMLIEGANRFGLAQLHQFRGRVGRGAEQSFCLLIPDSPDGAENARLQAMVETTDGFVLAERDLEQRGPGQFLGTRQAGFSELRVANLSDVRLIEKARQAAQSLFSQDGGLSLAQHLPLAHALEYFWGGSKGDIS